MKLLFIRLEIVLFLSFGGSFSLFAQFVGNATVICMAFFRV